MCRRFDPASVHSDRPISNDGQGGIALPKQIRRGRQSTDSAPAFFAR